MNNKDFITAIADRTGYNTADVQNYVSTIIDAMTSKFESGDAITIAGFGTLEVRKKLERIVVNPSTQQRMLVPPKLVLSFRPAATLKDEIK
jgi:nucleoid DNA-binding protein